MPRCALALAFVAVLSCVPDAVHAQFPTARFESTNITAYETDGSVTVTLLISGPGTGPGGIIVESADGTAVSPDDFGAVFTYVEWGTGDTAPKTFTVPIVDDGTPDSGETFTLQLLTGDGVDVGSPSQATVTIMDARSGVTAGFVVDDEILPAPDGAAHFLVEGGTDYVATLRLDQVPPTAVTVQVQVGDEASPRDIVFDDVQERTLVVPSPPQPSSGVVATVPLSIVSVGDERYSSWSSVRAQFGWTFSFEVCYFCYWTELLAVAGFSDCDGDCAQWFGSICPVGSFSRRTEPSVMGLLRRYRDEVLETSAGGSYYAGIVAEFGAAAANALIQDPGLVYKMWQARGPWLDAIQAIVDGDGSANTITAAMRDDLLEILQRLGAAGDAGLGPRIDEEIARLGLDTIVGLSMSEFQTRVEQAGTSVPAETESWSGLKARFGTSGN